MSTMNHSRRSMADYNTTFIGSLKSLFTFSFPHLFKESSEHYKDVKNSSGKRGRLDQTNDVNAAPPKRIRITITQPSPLLVAPQIITESSSSSERRSSSSSRDSSSPSIPSTRSPSSSDSDAARRVVIIPRRLSAGENYFTERRGGSLPPHPTQSSLITQQRDGSFPPSLNLLQSQPAFVRKPTHKPPRKPTSKSSTPIPSVEPTQHHRKCLISGCECNGAGLLHGTDLQKMPLIPSFARAKTLQRQGQFTFTDTFSRRKRNLTLMADDGSDVVVEEPKQEEESSSEETKRIGDSVPLVVVQERRRPKKKRKARGDIKAVEESTPPSSSDEEEKRSTKRQKLEPSPRRSPTPRKPSTFSAAYIYDDEKDEDLEHDTRKRQKSRRKTPESSIQRQLRLLRVELP